MSREITPTERRANAALVESILSSNGSLMLTVSLEDLRAVVLEVVRRERQSIEAAAERRQSIEADPLLTVGELAERLSVSSTTVYGWVQRERIPYIKLGAAVRFRLREVCEALGRGPKPDPDPKSKTKSKTKSK